MQPGFPLLSSDGHLEVKPERWTSYMPANYREEAPRTIKLEDGGDAILVPGQKPYPVNYVDLRAGRSSEDWQPIAVKVEDTAGVGPPEQRVREQDIDGLGAEVLFPNMAAGPRLWRMMASDDGYRAAVRAYNDWLAQEYCPVAPDRLLGMGMIPWSGIDDAVAELEHCARIGLKGVVLGILPSSKGYPTPEDEKFWSAAASIGLPVTTHVSYHRDAADPTFLYPDADPEIVKKVGRNLADLVARWGFPPALSISQIILDGVFDRHPDLQLFFAETRLGWVPFWMEQADYWYERHRHWAQRLLGSPPLRMKPSDYVRQHIHFSIQHVECVAMRMRDYIGVDHIMFATDFPHIECDWPNTKDFLPALFDGVSPEDRFKIAAGNMVKFFKLEDTEVGRTVLAQAPAAVAAD